MDRCDLPSVSIDPHCSLYCARRYGTWQVCLEVDVPYSLCLNLVVSMTAAQPDVARLAVCRRIWFEETVLVREGAWEYGSE